MNGNSGFAGLRAVRTCRQHLLATPDKVFPLLCPTREYEWIQPWTCRLLYSRSGVAELDCIFVTEFPGDGEEVWVVSVYRPNEEIQFMRFNGRRVIRYRITLTDNGDGTTEAEWQQVLSGLDEEGNQAVARVSDESYQKQILELEQLLNHYLTTGTMLKWLT